MSTRDLVKMAMYLAMFAALDVISNAFVIFRMPQGGTFGLGVIALILASYDLGPRKGIFVGLVSILVQYITTPPLWFISWPQFFLDYILAYGIYGVAVLIPNSKVGKIPLLWGAIFVNLVRLSAHVVSGVVYYQTTWWGSFAYNGWYMIPTTIYAFILSSLLYTRLKLKK